MNRFDPRDLQVMIAVHEERSFVRAAEKLGVAQSGVSWRVRRLEQKLDGPLFERLQYGVRPTELGERFCAYARRVIALLEEGEAEFARRKRSA